jgi:hypothetical protein
VSEVGGWAMRKKEGVGHEFNRSNVDSSLLLRFVELDFAFFLIFELFFMAYQQTS